MILILRALPGQWIRKKRRIFLKRQSRTIYPSLQLAGGEITHRPEFTAAVIRRALALKMKVHKPPTNCFIGQDRRAAAGFFKSLRECGYTSGFRISIDPYHNGKIPLSYISAFIKEYSEFFSPSSLTIGSCYYDKREIFSLYDRLIILLIQEGFKDVSYSPEKKRFLLDGSSIKFGIWKPTRPSWKPLEDSEVDLKILETTRACLGPKGMGYLWIEPSLDVRLCSCNGGMFNNCLLAGNLGKESLASIIAKARQNPLITILANEGPAGLRRELNREEPVLDVSKKYTHMCELCCEILNNKEFVSRLLDAPEEAD